MTKRFFFASFFLLGLLGGVVAQPKMIHSPNYSPDTNRFNLVPKPAFLYSLKGEFNFDKSTTVYVDFTAEKGRFKAQVDSFLETLQKVSGLKLNVVNYQMFRNIPKNSVVITTITKKPADYYFMSVTPDFINIQAASSMSLFYCFQTLQQLLPAEIYGSNQAKEMSWSAPSCSIIDSSRYQYRGAMLDVGRHFFPVSAVKRYIDLLAMHKINTFHWHLTEDQGWRIEIKKYPKLTQFGSKRKETMVGHYKDQKWDGKPYGGFYTQEEVKEIVKYASSKFITVIPEIEMPGHALAAIASYPYLSCDSTKTYEVGTKWGVEKIVFCPSERTFKFLEDVLSEVLELFPSKFIHIGGDECPKDAWKSSAFCQALIKEKGLKDEHELQSYFIQRIEKFLNSKGRDIIGWDEILEGGLAPNATVMSWRGVAGGIEAAKQKHNVIMSPTTFCYIDYYQADPKAVEQPVAIGGLVTLEKIYGYEPTPSDFTPEQAKYILGAQANLWTEYVPTLEKAEYMAFPRLIALAELTWSPKGSKNFADFQRRLAEHYKRLDVLGVNYFGSKLNANLLKK